MILIRRYKKLFKSTIACAIAHNIRDIQFCVPHLCHSYVALSCELKECIYMHNLKNIRNYGSNVNGMQIKSKEQLLYRSINNCNVNLRMIESLIEDLENNAYNISQILSLKLLNCCGNVLYNEPLKIRQELTNRVWNLLKERNCNLTIDHYHALLQTYIDNDYRIDPIEFLKNMTIKPEYETYCLLLQVFPNSNDCAVPELLIADIDKTDKKIYDALIYAYAINGNTEKAKDVIKLMKAQNIEPSITTYLHLMYAFARNNDIETVIENLMIHKPSISYITKLIKFLSLMENGTHIPDILSCLHPLTKEEHSVTSVIVQLVHAGHSLDAYKVVAHVPISNEAQHIKETFALCLLEEMVKLNIDQKIVLKVINDFAIEHSILDIWQKAALLTLRRANETLALTIFNEMNTRGISISYDCFWPLFLNKHESGDEAGIYSIIQHMIALNVKIDSKTFINYIFPYINTNNAIITVKKMIRLRISTNCIIEPFVHFLLNSNRLKESLATCSHFKKKVDCQDKLNVLILNYSKTKDINCCINFLFNSCYNGHGFAATFLKKLLDLSEHEINTIITFLTAMKRYKALIPPADVEDILDKISYKNLNEKHDILRLISSITASNFDNYNTGSFVHPQYMNLEQLYSHLDELQSKGKNTRGVLRKIFMAVCNQNCTEEINKIMQTINSSNIKWTSGMKLILFDYYVRNKMIDEASSVLHEVKFQFPQFKIDNFKIIRFAKLLVEHNKIDEAFNIVKNSIVNQKPNADKTINDLLCLLATKDTSNSTAKMRDLLIKRGYYTNYDRILNI